MKPKPLASLNHFTVPVVRDISCSLLRVVIGSGTLRSLRAGYAARPTTVAWTCLRAGLAAAAHRAPGTAANEKGAGANASPLCSLGTKDSASCVIKKGRKRRKDYLRSITKSDARARHSERSEESARPPFANQTSARSSQSGFKESTKASFFTLA
jgi:hypothetical protein